MNDITKLTTKREVLKAKIKLLEKECEQIDAKLMELLSQEGGERYSLNPKKMVSVVRSSMKVFDMDKVYELVGDERQVKQVDKKTGEIKRLNLFNVNDSALKLFVMERQLGDKYKQSFYLKGKKPFIKIELT